MRVEFNNKTKYDCIVCVSNQKHIIKPNEKVIVPFDNENIFEAWMIKPSTIKNLLFFKSIATAYNFVLKSKYRINCDLDDIYIDLTYKNLTCQNLACYEFVVTYSNSNIVNISNCVYDENMIKPKVQQIKKREKTLTIFMKILDVLQNLFYILVPTLIVAVVIYLKAGLHDALNVGGMIFSITAVVALVVKLFLDKFIKHFDKKTDNQIKDASELYKDFNSYFSEEYIFVSITSNR